MLTNKEFYDTVYVKDLSDGGERFSKIGLYLCEHFPDVKIWRDQRNNESITDIYNDETDELVCCLYVKEREWQ